MRHSFVVQSFVVLGTLALAWCASCSDGVDTVQATTTQVGIAQANHKAPSAADIRASEGQLVASMIPWADALRDESAMVGSYPSPVLKDSWLSKLQGKSQAEPQEGSSGGDATEAQATTAEAEQEQDPDRSAARVVTPAAEGTDQATEPATTGPATTGPATTGPATTGPAEGETDAPAEGEEGSGEGGGGRRGGEEKNPEADKDRRGIPVRDELIQSKCVQCHERNDDGLMSRISYMRKSPEGWELTLKRMIRLNNVMVSPEEARDIVRYLSTDHGLARAEAETSMYEVERRVHWSEEEHEKELLESCAECHTLGRVLAQRRDSKEWSLLKATHLAFFPLVDFQAFRGRRSRDNVDWESLSESESSERWEQMQSSRGPDQADRVLKTLTKDQPLFTPEWEAWQINRREVPVAGEWAVVGHEISRGDVRGDVIIKRVGDDEYETTWKLDYEDGRRIQRTGKGILYAGYSWRGRSNTTAPREPEMLREVLLLNEEWDEMKGRIFTGEYHELGMDVRLVRKTGAPQVLSLQNRAVTIPAEGHWISVATAGIPRDVKAHDFHMGQGVTITELQVRSDSQLRLRVDVARDAEQGERFLSYRAQRGTETIILHDTIDYIAIRPGQGMSRIGGSFRPRQLERFEAVGMNRGRDGESYTDDDFEVRVVPARWHLEEFPVRENDDDLAFVGSIVPETGVFTPGADGPNPERRWDANNIGDVYVVATCTMNVRKIEKPKKPKKKDKASNPGQTEEAGEGAHAESGEVSESSESSEASEHSEPAEVEEVAEASEPKPLPPIVMEDREFRARGHLLVMVPIYVNWDKYEWDRR